MEIFKQKLDNGNTIEYKRLDNGTCYHNQTPLEVVEALEQVRENKKRIRVWYGENGKSWNEEYNIMGTIGRSTGSIKIPLLIHNQRSLGGNALLDHCIVKIIDTRTKRTLYQHNKFKQSFFEADDTLVYECKEEGQKANAEIYASCKTHEQALKLSDFMNGKKNTK